MHWVRLFFTFVLFEILHAYFTKTNTGKQFNQTSVIAVFKFFHHMFFNKFSSILILFQELLILYLDLFYLLMSRLLMSFKILIAYSYFVSILS